MSLAYQYHQNSQLPHPMQATLTATSSLADPSVLSTENTDQISNSWSCSLFKKNTDNESITLDKALTRASTQSSDDIVPIPEEDLSITYTPGLPNKSHLITKQSSLEDSNKLKRESEESPTSNESPKSRKRKIPKRILKKCVHFLKSLVPSINNDEDESSKNTGTQTKEKHLTH